MSRSVQPFISIVMPCYNGERYLRKVLEAFFEQSYPNKKLIIVDGKSSDSSHQIITEFIDRGCPIVWDRSLDSGISSAINIGLKHLAEEDVFGYLGADDVLLPNVLNRIGTLFNIASDVDGIYFDSYSYLGETGKLTYRKCPTSDFTLGNLLKFGTIVGLQNIYIKGKYLTSNRFDEKNRYSMDYELYIRLFKSKVMNFSHIPEPSTINMMHGNFSMQYAHEGAMEALNAAIKQVGYTPVLIYRCVRLWISVHR